MQALTEQVELLRPGDFATVPGTSYAVHGRALRDSRGNFVNRKWYEFHDLTKALSQLYSAKLSFVSTRDLERGLVAGVIVLNEWTGTNSLVSVPDQDGIHHSRFTPKLPKSRYLKLVHDVVPSTYKGGLSYSYDPNDVIDTNITPFSGNKFIRQWNYEEGFPKEVGDKPNDELFGARMRMDKDVNDDYGERPVLRGLYYFLPAREGRFYTGVFRRPSGSVWHARLKLEGELPEVRKIDEKAVSGLPPDVRKILEEEQNSSKQKVERIDALLRKYG